LRGLDGDDPRWLAPSHRLQPRCQNSLVEHGKTMKPMTPLTWSVIRFTLEDWIFLPGFSIVGNIGGFPYLNISIFATLFRLMGGSGTVTILNGGS